MGINISVYEIGQTLTDRYESPPEEYFYFHKERHPTWDYCRHAGDRDFWLNDAFEWSMRYEGDDPGNGFESAFHRPKNIDKAIEWVKANIPDINQSRLINILEEMRANENLYFSCSY